MTLRTAVVGGGTVSNIHLNSLEMNPRTDLVAICDVDEETARRIAEERDIEAYFDVGTMVDELDLDWVHVCTPVQTHLAVAKTVIEAGIPLQIEKPITETYEEFEELAAYAEQHGVVVSEKHNHDFDPVVRAAATKLQNGDLGEVRGVDVIYTGSSRPDDPNRGPWNFDLSGGEFEEGIPHPLYIGLHLGGYPRNEDALSATTALYGEYDRDFTYDGAQVQYVTDDEVLCTTKVLGDTRPVRRVLIHGSRQSLTADLISQTLVEHDRDYKASAKGRVLDNVDEILDRTTGTITNARAVLERARSDDWDVERHFNAHYYQDDAESRALLDDSMEMPVPLEESRWMIRLMQEIRDTAARNDTVDRESESTEPVEQTLGREARQ